MVMKTHIFNECDPVDISEEDVMDAMRTIPGYIDITPRDFKEVYRIAYTLAKDRMANRFKARDMMSTPVYLVPQDTGLIETAALLAEKGISGAPVVDGDGKIIGVVSEKDFLSRMGAGKPPSFMQVIAHCLTHKGCVAAHMNRMTVTEIMSAPAVTAPPEISMGEITAILNGRTINRLPIVDADHRPIGIVTRTDLVATYCMLR
jgi:CBS domain-containing membrane protein